MARTIYALALLYSSTIAIIFTVYGISVLIKQERDRIGILSVLAGAILILGLGFLHFDGLTQIPAAISTVGPIGKVLFVLSVIGAILSADYLFARIWPLFTKSVTGALSGQVSSSRRATLGALLGATTISLLAGTTLVQSNNAQSQPEGGDQSPSESDDQSPVASSDFTLLDSFETPELPTALAFTDQYGYLTNRNGNIYRFERPTPPIESVDVEFEEVFTGITAPQGIEVVDDVLYTVDLGDAGNLGPGESGKIENLRSSSADVIALDIDSGGDLTNQRTILSELPVVNRQHSPNDITTGPDGRLYVPVGHIPGPNNALIEDGEYQPDPDIHPNIDYLGTVMAFNPDGSDVEIIARGTRNVYHIAFDGDGNLFGADNDGESARSKMWHALYHIDDGDHFGYPEYGTLDDGAADKKSALWIMDGVAPAGFETADKIGYEDGVLVGTATKVSFVPLAEDDDGFYVPGFSRPEPTIMELNGFWSPIVQAGPDGFLYIGDLNAQECSILQVTSS